MATITELANAIEGYIDNRATTRDILIDQIKRATRQIRQKENNLHQDLEQILALQNNPLNQINMALPAGFIMPELYSFEQDHEKEFDNKNCELQNVLDNSAIGANITAIHGANARAITGPVAVNARGGVPVILAGIQSGTHESITSFWAKIQKYGDQLGYTPVQKKTNFMSEVRYDILNDIIMIGYYKPINGILDSLEEMKLHHEILGPLPLYSSYSLAPPTIPNITYQQQEIFLADIQKIFQEQIQVPTPQTVEPKDLDSDYPVKNFQRSRPQRSNNSIRFDRIKEGLDETRDAVNQLTNQFKKLNICKCDICEETGHNNSGGYDKVENTWCYALEKKYAPINKNLHDNSAITSFDLAQEEESKESDKWLSSLQYLNANINDLTISESFLDLAVKQFQAYHHSLGWYTDVLVTLKDKEDKTFTVIGNFVH
ncbi:hypothetical protein C1645_830911 [Glomus cerebriforme]|uniref:Uncharacterized protein n=1 Tax=Glomus cerebriforme TaxID=658196 RepID=A0A397SRQ3_9GLOM|nr:hypothetical protein C1645_830911 [Glomus cerebriforme]